jgi:hypothetical protein
LGGVVFRDVCCEPCGDGVKHRQRVHHTSMDPEHQGTRLFVRASGNCVSAVKGRACQIILSFPNSSSTGKRRMEAALKELGHSYVTSALQVGRHVRPWVVAALQPRSGDQNSRERFSRRLCKSLAWKVPRTTVHTCKNRSFWDT